MPVGDAVPYTYLPPLSRRFLPRHIQWEGDESLPPQGPTRSEFWSSASFGGARLPSPYVSLSMEEINPLTGDPKMTDEIRFGLGPPFKPNILPQKLDNTKAELIARWQWARTLRETEEREREEINAGGERYRGTGTVCRPGAECCCCRLIHRPPKESI